MGEEYKRAILEEYYRRQLDKHNMSDRFGKLRCPHFTKQNEVLDARQHRYKAINCTRRSGKSQGEVIDHLEIMSEFPGSRNLYMGLTLDSVREITWDIWQGLSDKYELGLKTLDKKIVIAPNGSKCRLFGVDSGEREMRKVLGQKIRKVSIDEAGSITINMARLCYQMIGPALIDLRPNTWLSLLGTCENIPNTFFQKVVDGVERGADWKVFKWSAHENPFMAKQWAQEIDEMTKQNPLVVEASWFKTHYLNQWVTDDDLQIILLPEDMYFDNLAGWQPENTVLGVDLGYNDDCSYSIVGHRFNEDFAIIMQSFKESQQDLTDVANTIRNLQRKYSINKIIVDGANKQGVEEIKNRHRIPLESAEKSDKATYLRLLRDDIVTGHVKALKPECGELITEWSSLIWKDENKQKEDDRCQNHASDSTLYAWRALRHYLYDPPEQRTDPNSDQFMKELERKEAEQMRQQIEEENFMRLIAMKNRFDIQRRMAA